MVLVLQEHGLVEAAGIEPASEEAATTTSTCVVFREILLPGPLKTEAPGKPARKVSRIQPGPVLHRQPPEYDAHSPALETQPVGTGA